MFPLAAAVGTSNTINTQQHTTTQQQHLNITRHTAGRSHTNTLKTKPGWADHPWWYVDTWSRVKHAVTFTHELLTWVKTAHPYWNRTGGADHIWHFAHDEGACWAPSEIYNASIILTHWGRLDKDHVSGTSYYPVRGREREVKKRGRGEERGRGRGCCSLSLAQSAALHSLTVWLCSLIRAPANANTNQQQTNNNAKHQQATNKATTSTTNNKQQTNNNATTHQDNYTAEVEDDPFQPDGFTRLIGRHPCYTPGRDAVLPLFRGPERYKASPYLGAPQLERDILLFHRGRMGLGGDAPAYSRGVRQRVRACACVCCVCACACVLRAVFRLLGVCTLPCPPIALLFLSFPLLFFSGQPFPTLPPTAATTAALPPTT